jgi:hypothetical protein
VLENRDVEFPYDLEFVFANNSATSNTLAVSKTNGKFNLTNLSWDSKPITNSTAGTVYRNILSLGDTIPLIRQISDHLYFIANDKAFIVNIPTATVLEIPTFGAAYTLDQTTTNLTLALESPIINTIRVEVRENTRMLRSVYRIDMPYDVRTFQYDMRNRTIDFKLLKTPLETEIFRIVIDGRVNFTNAQRKTIKPTYKAKPGLSRVNKDVLAYQRDTREDPWLNAPEDLLADTVPENAPPLKLGIDLLF